MEVRQVVVYTDVTSSKSPENRDTTAAIPNNHPRRKELLEAMARGWGAIGCYAEAHAAKEASEIDPMKEPARPFYQAARED